MAFITQDSTRSVLNTDELLARCMGNIGFAERILAKFQDRFEHDLEELDKALQARDADAVARTAHRIKGASANVAASRLHEHAAEIERLGRTARLSDIPHGLEQLRDEWSRFVHEASSLELGSCNAG
jgi:HPt (histidine-containing phosphotransfer) domain-containing protein